MFIPSRILNVNFLHDTIQILLKQQLDLNKTTLKRYKRCHNDQLKSKNKTCHILGTMISEGTLLNHKAVNKFMVNI